MMTLFIAVPIAILIEGLGLRYGRELALILIILLPLILFITNRNLKIKTPGFLKNLFIFFTVVNVISALFAKNISIAAPYIFLYPACFLIFAYINNFKRIVTPFVLPIIFGLSICFCLCSIFLSQIIAPTNGYQLIFSFFGFHNHLGDFLLLPLSACFYLIMNKQSIKKQFSFFGSYSALVIVLLIIFFLPYFIFSFSRSAYVSLVFVLILMVFNFFRHKIVKLNIALLCTAIFVIFLSSLVISSVVKTQSKTGLFYNMNNNPASNKLLYKTPFGGRGEYVREAVLSLMDKPILGVGPGNFTYASKKYNLIPGLWTESSHNIFLDIIVENGIFAGIAFALIMFHLFKNTEKNVHFYMACALFLNFQTDYTFRIYSLLTLFFVLIALCQPKSKSPVT